MTSSADDQPYVVADGDLSQGDIVEDIPWGLIEAPFSICRPDNAKLQQGSAKYGPLDGFSKPFDRGTEILHTKAQVSVALVLWHGCQIDKFKQLGKPLGKWFAAIAPVFELARFVTRADEQANVRAGKHRAYFPLPAFVSDQYSLPESYVDLRYIWSVRQQPLTEFRQARLSPAYLPALYAHLFTFFTRLSLPEESLVCNHCGRQIDLQDILPSVAEND
jgi:hypothetical protein